MLYRVCACDCFSVILYTVQLMSQTISEMFLAGSHFHAVVSYKRVLNLL